MHLAYMVDNDGKIVECAIDGYSSKEEAQKAHIRDIIKQRDQVWNELQTYHEQAWEKLQAYEAILKEYRA